jgi:hypothetical protein
MGDCMFFFCINLRDSISHWAWSRVGLQKKRGFWGLTSWERMSFKMFQDASWWYCDPGAEATGQFMNRLLIWFLGYSFCAWIHLLTSWGDIIHWLVHSPHCCAIFVLRCFGYTGALWYPSISAFQVQCGSTDGFHGKSKEKQSTWNDFPSSKLQIMRITRRVFFCPSCLSPWVEHGWNILPSLPGGPGRRHECGCPSKGGFVH